MKRHQNHQWLIKKTDEKEAEELKKKILVLTLIRENKL